MATILFLTINAGSSSIKFCVFDADTLEQQHVGSVTGIGLSEAYWTVDGQQQAVTAPDHETATHLIQDWLQQTLPASSTAAVGHRIVHGGPHFSRSCVITDDVLAQVQAVAPFDPEHLPAQLALIVQLGQGFPGVPQVACFDTAFFHDLPAVARLLPIPRRFADEGVRRYGFHGLSYTYLLQEFERVAGHEAARGKIIMAHLGNGASLAALQGGKPIDTSMGFTPAGGVPMSTRSGDLDPGVMTYLAAQKQLGPEHLSQLVNFESGMLGVSGTTADMKQLLELEASDPRAKEATNIFCYHVRKYIGAYAAALGGINSLIFSGGIGEVAPAIRERICQGLEFLGIELDGQRNLAQDERISADGSRVGVHVLTTNEAVVIARDMQELLKTKGDT